jgi:hypothetical protein
LGFKNRVCDVAGLVEAGDRCSVGKPAMQAAGTGVSDPGYTGMIAETWKGRDADYDLTPSSESGVSKV